MKRLHALGLAALVAAPLPLFAEQPLPLPAKPEPGRIVITGTAPAFAGFELMPVDAPTRALFKLPATGGLLIVGIAPGSPAEGKFGQGDILLQVDGKPIASREAIRAAIRAHKPGDTARFTVARGGRTETIELKLAAAPGMRMFHASIGQPGMNDAEELMRQLNERMRRDMEHAGGISIGGAENDIHIVLPETPGASANFTKVRRVKTVEGTVTLTEAAGKKTALVKDAAGKELYNGDYSDTEKKVPDWAHKALKAGPHGTLSLSLSGGVTKETPAADKPEAAPADDKPATAK